MKLMSLFDGSGGFPLAASLCGIEPVYASEVEPYPIAVTKSRFPNMKHLGDVSRIKGAEIEPVDIITFGSPCQDMSVAGKRAGLKHTAVGDEETTRSGLFMEAIRVADFRGECAQEILFKRESLRGYFEAGRTPWQGIAADAQNCVGTDDRAGESDSLIAFAQNQRNEIRDLGEKAGCIQAEPGMKQQTFIVENIEVQAGQGYPCAMIPYTLKIRSGCEGGCKGALVQKDKTATLATNNDQYLFQPIIVDNIGGQTEYARQSDTAPCLKATHYKNPPCITVSAGFCPEESAKTRGVGYAEEQSPTLRAGAVPAVVYDARGNGDGQIVSTITGDHNNRITDYTCLVVEPAVRCYDIGEARLRTPSEYIEKTPTLTARCGTGGNNVPGVVYCLQGNGIDRADTAGCNDKGWRENECYTLNTIDRPAAVQARYIVRRLTPTECARLQGFPDLWGHLNKKESFTDEEYKFWIEVRNAYAKINNKAVKDYTKAQILTWYNKLHTDSAEYKMWGNGIALPNALYVMQGIAAEAEIPINLF